MKSANSVQLRGRVGLLLGTMLFIGAIAAPMRAGAQLPVTSDAPASAPEAERRAKEIVSLIHSGDRQAIKAYARENIEATAARGPFGPISAPELLARLHHQSRGALLVEAKPNSPTAVTARYRSQMLDMIGGVHISVSPQAPYKITELAPRRFAVSGDPAPAADAARVARLDQMARRMADADYFSGVVMIAKGDKPLFAQAYGMADRERRIPNTLDTSFNIGSMNKLFTATAIVQLVEQGKLSYDDPLSKFMPDFPDPESAKRIQIKHLLSHTSGLRNYFNQAFQSSPMTRFRGMKDYLEVAREPGLLFEPGTRWSYSNTGLLVAGRIVEIVSGQDYYDYIRDHIYQPAGMTGTDSYEADKKGPKLARGYDVAFKDGVLEVRDTADVIPVRGSPAGGGFATAGDLVRFAHAFREGKLVSRESVALMTSAKPELNSKEYGYGVLRGRLIPTGRDIAGHPGDAPGTCATFDMVRDTPEPYTIVILSNGNSVANCHPLAMQAYALFAPGKSLASR